MRVFNNYVDKKRGEHSVLRLDTTIKKGKTMMKPKAKHIEGSTKLFSPDPKDIFSLLFLQTS